MRSREEMCMDEIRSVVGNGKALVMVSGGVDSTVCAALLHKVFGGFSLTLIRRLVRIASRPFTSITVSCEKMKVTKWSLRSTPSTSMSIVSCLPRVSVCRFLELARILGSIAEW